MSNTTTVVTFPDKKTDLLVRLLAALESSHGTINWEDIFVGATRAAERKCQEAVAALVNSLPLTDILMIKEIAAREALLARSKKQVVVISEQETKLPTSKSQRRRAGRNKK